MNDSTIGTSLPTYSEDSGHGEPRIPVRIHLNQGMTVDLGLTEKHDFDPDGDRTPNVYIERREGRWQVNIDPDGLDIVVAVNIMDDGSVQVRDAKGNVVLEEEVP